MYMLWGQRCANSWYACGAKPPSMVPRPPMTLNQRVKLQSLTLWHDEEMKTCPIMATLQALPKTDVSGEREGALTSTRCPLHPYTSSQVASASSACHPLLYLRARRLVQRVCRLPSPQHSYPSSSRPSFVTTSA